MATSMAQDGHAALQVLIHSKGRNVQPCLRQFLPLLFSLAEHHQVSETEEAVYVVLEDLRTHCEGWARSGLPAHLWVTGMAVRRFRMMASSTDHAGVLQGSR